MSNHGVWALMIVVVCATSCRDAGDGQAATSDASTLGTEGGVAGSDGEDLGTTGAAPGSSGVDLDDGSTGGQSGDDTGDASDTGEPIGSDLFFFRSGGQTNYVACISGAGVVEHELFSFGELSLSDDGASAATFSEGTIELWSLGDCPPVSIATIDLPGNVFTFDEDHGWSPDAAHLFGYLDGELGLIRVADHSWISLGVPASVSTLARFSADGRWLALVDNAGGVTLVDTTGTVTSTSITTSDAVWWWPELAADGTHLSYYVGDATAPSVRFVDISAAPSPTLTLANGHGYAWAPVGARVAHREPGGGISIVEPASGAVTPVITGEPRRFAWSSDGSLLAAATTTDLVVWDVASASAIESAAGDDVHGFSPDGRWLAFGRDGDLLLVDLGTGSEFIVSELFYGPGHQPGNVWFDPGSEALLWHDEGASYFAPVRYVELGGIAPSPSVDLLSYSVGAWRGTDGLYATDGGVDDGLYVQRIDAGAAETPELVFDGTVSRLWLPGPSAAVSP